MKHYEVDLISIAFSVASLLVDFYVVHLILKGQEKMNTDQAALDAYIQGPLTAALVSLETTGASVASGVTALIARVNKNPTAPASDLTPQLQELEALASRMTSDASAGSALATEIETANANAPAPTSTGTVAGASMTPMSAGTVGAVKAGEV